MFWFRNKKIFFWYALITKVLVFVFRKTTVKLVLSGHLKIDKTKILKTKSSLMKVESIAECSLGAFCNTFNLHYWIIGLEKQILVFILSGIVRQILLYCGA